MEVLDTTIAVVALRYIVGGLSATVIDGEWVLTLPEFLAINPLGRVPAIRDGNFTLHESLAIMVYLDRKHPNPHWPIRRSLG
jgi:glutathione S-transferase